RFHLLAEFFVVLGPEFLVVVGPRLSRCREQRHADDDGAAYQATDPHEQSLRLQCFKRRRCGRRCITTPSQTIRSHRGDTARNRHSLEAVIATLSTVASGFLP